MSATSRPWRYQREVTVGGGEPRVVEYQIYNVGGPFGHPATCDREEDAQLIVRAVNAHDGLLASAKIALAYLLAVLKHDPPAHPENLSLLVGMTRDLTTALEKAEAQ